MYPLDLIVSRDVALVGNAPSALEEDNGRFIDELDIVIRVNAGMPAPDQAGSIGTRTDVLAAATRRSLDASLVYGAPEHLWWMKLTRFGQSELGELLKEREISWVWPEKWEKACREFVGSPPSTGVRLAWALVNRLGATTVSLFGVDCWESGESWWKEQRPAAHLPGKRPHSGAKEREALLALGFQSVKRGVWGWYG